MRGSYYCAEHHKQEPTVSLYINNQLFDYRVKSIYPANLMVKSRTIKKIHDVINTDETTDNIENYLFLVESVEAYEDNFYWLQHKDIPRQLHDQFLIETIERQKLEEYDEISCNTNKGYKLPYNNKSRTKG